MSQEVGNLVVRIGMDSTGFQDGISNLNRQMRVIQSEFKAVAAGSSDFGNSLNDLRLKSDSLTKQVAIQQQKVDALRQAHEKSIEAKGANAKATQNLEIMLNKARAELAHMQAELNKTNSAITIQSSSWYNLSQNLNSVGNKFQDIGHKMSDVGKNLSMKVTAPITGLGALAFKASVDLDSAFTGVIKTVEATDAQLASLKEGFQDMAKNIPIVTTELYGIGEAAGQLGIKTENILDFTEVMAKLGVTTNMSSEQAATALARLANITQMPQTEFDRLGATIVALGNNLATTESEIVEMGLRIAGAGSQIGLTEAQILAFAGALSSVGIAAEAGGSAISRVMIALANATASGGEKLDQFASVAGMTSAQFKQAFEKDAATAIITFIEGLDRISQSGGNVFAVLEQLGFSEINVRDALLRAAGAGDLFRESLEIGNEAWRENIALNKEAELRFNTTASQLQLFKNNLQLTAAAFGDALAPALLRILDILNPLIEKFAQLNDSSKTIILVVAGIAAAIGPLLVMGGAVVSAIGTIATALGGLVTWFGTVGSAASLLGGAFAFITGPIGILVGAIAAIITVSILLVRNWEDIKVKVIDVWNSIKFTAESVWNSLKSYFDEWGKNILLISVGPAGWAVLLAQKLGINWDSIKAITTNTWNSISSTLLATWNNIKNTSSVVWDGIKNAIVNPIYSAQNTLNAIINSIQNAFSNMHITIPRPKLPHITVTTKYKTVGTISVPYPDFDVSFYAKGTDFHPGGWAIVGEEGPELLNLPRGTQVIPNNKLANLGETVIQQFINRDNKHLDLLVNKIIRAIEKHSGVQMIGPAVNIEKASFEDKADMQAFAIEVKSILATKG